MARTSSKIPDLIYHDLCAEIGRGTYRVGDLLPSENELAKRYDASRFYARKAFEILEKEGVIQNRQGMGRLVCQTPGRSVRRLAVLDALRKTENLDSTRLPGHVVEWQQGVFTACDQLGITSIYLTGYRQTLQDRLNLLREAVDCKIDALIFRDGLTDPGEKQVFLSAVTASGLPALCFGEAQEGKAIDCFAIDDYAAGQMLTEHAIENGHREIGFLCGDLHDPHLHERYRGYAAALREHGCELIQDAVVSVPHGLYDSNWTRNGEYAVRQLETRGSLRRVTCLVCPNDVMSQSAIRTLGKLGLRVPGDISFVSFDNDPRCFADELTTGYFPYFSATQKAAKRFIQGLNQPQRERIRMKIAPQLMVRNSVSRLAPTRRAEEQA